MNLRNLLLIGLVFISVDAYGQQDVDFHLNSQYFKGQKILKVKRDFNDPYLWVLAQNNKVYRLNSITKAIDDYSNSFTLYNGIKFIDIAGLSQDSVYIATNSKNVIAYRRGAIKLIDTLAGIPDTINSVGFIYDYFLSKTLLIGTNKGLCSYDPKTELLNYTPASKYTDVFEATYRRTMYSDYYNDETSDIQLFPVAIFTSASVYACYLWQSTQFGYHINTAFYTPPYVFSSFNEVGNISLYWGNDKGMFQINQDQSYHLSQYKQYLNNIQVNKITDIYGLTSFGDAHTKENLLIGTNQGLYFSNSLYSKMQYGGLNPFSLFYYAPLGNIVINDICVNAASIQPPICEDGIWLATNGGLYLIKPDYASYVDPKPIQSVHFENEGYDITTAQFCSGNSITAVIDNNLVNGNAIQWYKDSYELPTKSADKLVIKDSGDYYAILYDPCENVHLESNHLKVDVISGPEFSFNYPDKIQQCDNTPLTLQTTDNPGYQYRWYTNGVLNGNNTSSCTVSQSGKYKVEVSACTDSWVPSKEVLVNLVQLPTPVITTDRPAYCIGDNAILSIAVPVDPSYTINWYKDNVLLTGNTNQNSATTNIAGNYTVSIINNSINTDGSTCSQSSAVQAISFNPSPTVSIEKIVNTTICDGQTIGLKANYNGGTVQWSTGETADQIAVTQAGTYTATITTAAGCQAAASMDIAFFPNPVFSVNDTSICTYKKQVVTLTAPSGFAQYAWNGQTGGQTYQISRPQTVSLTVTDANGCQATQQIKVADRCPDIYIPNTFTPNGDGINDTWVIEGLDYDPSSSVKVFTRNGVQVFNSIGYGTPWNGEYKGKKLPAGAYYYIVTAKNGSQKFSGSLTIIY